MRGTAYLELSGWTPADATRMLWLDPRSLEAVEIELAVSIQEERDEQEMPSPFPRLPHEARHG